MYKEAVVFGADGRPIYPAVVFHPGESLKDEIEARGLVKKEFAKKIGLLPQHLSELFAGKRHFTAALAWELEKVLGIDAEFWVHMQADYDLFVIRNKRSIRNRRSNTTAKKPKRSR